jgi:hypothetical protein
MLDGKKRDEAPPVNVEDIPFIPIVMQAKNK